MDAKIIPAITQAGDSEGLPVDTQYDDEKATDFSELPAINAKTDNILPEGSTDPIYLAKAQVLNDAIAEIGMGKYQWFLFGVAGFGWMMDNMWPIITSLIFTPVINELQPTRGPFLQLAQNIGLLVGAFTFGLGSDIFGRRWAFNITLFITGAWGLIAGSAPTFAAIGVFACFWSIGVGGNLPVDSAVFLEFIPAKNQYLLTILSIYWAFGQLLATLIAWGLLTNYSCSDAIGACPRSENMGWRYFLFTMGGITLICFVLRFFVFHLYETPKYLMSRGHDEQAVEVIQAVAKYNGRTSSLRPQHLTSMSGKVNGAPAQDTSARAAVRRRFEKFSGSHVKELFSSPQMAFSTSMIIFIWALIGLAFPLYNAFLPYLLATRGAETGKNSTYITYRNEVIIAILGIPGALAGGLLVELPTFGRKGALSSRQSLRECFCLLPLLRRHPTLCWDGTADTTLLRTSCTLYCTHIHRRSSQPKTAALALVLPQPPTGSSA